MKMLIETSYKPAFENACALADFTCSFGEEENGCVWAYANPQVFTTDRELVELRHVFLGMHYASAKHEIREKILES